MSAPVPELPGDMFLRTTPNVSIVRPPARTKPSFADLTTLPEALPPISGGTLAVTPDGSKAVAADSERDLIYIVDIAANKTEKLSLPPGSEPGRVVIDDQGQAHVVLRNAGRLARIALGSGQVDLSESICQYPRGLAFSTSTHSVHVACADGQLVQLSAATHAVMLRTHTGSSDLRDVVVDARGKLAVSRFRDASLLRPEREPSEVVLPKLPWPSLDIGQANTEPAEWLSTLATFAFRTALAGNGSLWMLHERAQIEPLEDDDFRGTKTQCGPAVQPALTQLDPETGAIIGSLQLQGASAPAVDLAISPSGTWIAIATPSAFAAGRSSVQLYRLNTLRDQALIDKQVNAEFPHSAVLMCLVPSSNPQALDTQAVAVAFDAKDMLYVQGRYPAYLHVIRPDRNGALATGTAAGETSLSLNDDPPRDVGHEWFHAELDASGVSCAACHAEGLDDAHVWQLSKGLRRTPSLRGGLSQTAPFAWGGEHDNLESVIQRFAGPSTPPEAVGGMARWLDKLAPLSLLDLNNSAANSGKMLFESAQLGCLECHNGPNHTNNQTVDVGTGGLYQVPSLTGLSLRAPYMHDGCAKDLEALFTAPTCAPSVHANLATLSDQEAADMQAYLRAL